jgi:NAD(P)-dependent dehydrogenase (short-subunit alcohol dehydrogenase family)
MTSLEGKVALITGAGKGAGRAVALLFAAHGLRVAVNDISPVNLDDMVQLGGGSIRGYPEDMAKKVGVQAVINQVEDDLGRIDILVNHAAVEPHASLLDMDEWDWHRVLDVNLTGAFLTMQSVARLMRRNASGLIFNLICLAPPERMQSAAYAASMHALIALTRAAAAELAQYGIFVHAVGKGIRQFHDADASVPTGLNEAILYLCSSSRNAQIVNVEAS